MHTDCCTRSQHMPHHTVIVRSLLRVCLAWMARRATHWLCLADHCPHASAWRLATCVKGFKPGLDVIPQPLQLWHVQVICNDVQVPRSQPVISATSTVAVASDTKPGPIEARAAVQVSSEVLLRQM